jgi:colanic acid/amylovoran biosynthesis glycosyltransferase
MHRGALRRLIGSLRRAHGLGHTFLARLYVLAPPLSRSVDVVHLGWLTMAAQSTELLAALEGPVVVSCHGSDLRVDPLADAEYRERLAAVFSRADLVHCVSHELAGRAIALGLEPERAYVRPWGVDTTRFRPDPVAVGAVAAPSTRPVRVLSVGRLHWVKGYDYALAALAQVRRAGIDVEYTIIGDGSDRDRLPVLMAVRDLGLDGRVTLLGARSQDEVLDALRDADVFLCASLSEGMNTAMLEAMAVGLPVVVTDVGGTREAVTDGVEGRLVAARDPDALAAAVLELAADARVRVAMGERGRHRVVADFDSDETARVMLEQYRRLVDRGVRRGVGVPTP